MTSKKLIAKYRVLNFWRSGLYHALYSQTQHLTDEQRRKRHEASEHLEQAELIIRQLFQADIGAAVTYEVRIGK